MSILKTELDQYFEEVYPAGTSREQHLQLSQAFYAGALVALGLAKKVSKTLDEDKAAEFVASMFAELNRVPETLKKERETLSGN